MPRLPEIVSFLDTTLRTAEIADYPGAHNGLQVENEQEISRVACAVDASLPVIEAAIKSDADLLIVHHGLFWQGVQALTGPVYRKFKLALDHGLAIYSSHLPLDIHPELGNNALLAEAVGLTDPIEFGNFKGNPLGLKGTINDDFDGLLTRLESCLGARPHYCPGHGSSLGTVGIITGGAGSELAQVAGAGVRTFITGEGPHWSYPLAEELGVNLIYGGHYATETFGVRALAESLETTFATTREFIDHPTGL